MSVTQGMSIYPTVTTVVEFKSGLAKSGKFLTEPSGNSTLKQPLPYVNPEEASVSRITRVVAFILNCILKFTAISKPSIICVNIL